MVQTKRLRLYKQNFPWSKGYFFCEKVTKEKVHGKFSSIHGGKKLWIKQIRMIFLLYTLKRKMWVKICHHVEKQKAKLAISYLVLIVMFFAK